MAAVRDFLAQKRIALVGMSHNRRDFSAVLFRELSSRGYDMVPVNPNLRETQGWHCFARVQDIVPPVDAALLITSPAVTDSVIRDCAEAGIHRVWMYRAGGTGAVSPEAVQFCREHNIEVVPGECPYMFLPGVGPIHWIHGCIRRLTGRFPK